MKKYIRYLLSIVTIFFIGCSNEEDVYKDSVLFSIEIKELFPYYVTVVVRHNATNDDTYYGFVVEGETPNLERAIDDFLFYANDAELQESVHSQCKQRFNIVGLVPNTVYTLVVFGMDEQGCRYGQPSSIIFTTPDNNLVANNSSNWEIKYNGHHIYNDTDYSLITVEVQGDITEHYFLATYPVKVFEEYDNMSDFIGFAHSQIQNDIQYSVGSDSWLDYNRVRTDSTGFYIYLTEGDYISCVIGLNKDFEPTGHYAITDIYHVDKYPALSSYANLLGDWRLVDATNKPYRITFTEHIVNKSLIMTGWGNLNNPPIPVYVLFDRNSGTISLENQLIFENYTFKAGDGRTFDGALIIRGIYVDSDGNTREAFNNAIEAHAQTNGDYIFKGFSITDPDNGASYDSGMALHIDGKVSVFYAKMMFPYTMSKIK